MHKIMTLDGQSTVFVLIVFDTTLWQTNRFVLFLNTRTNKVSLLFQQVYPIENVININLKRGS